MAAIRFSASGFRRGRNLPAPRLLAVDHTFDPGNLPFFCYAGYPGVDLAGVGLTAPVQLAQPVAVGLPMHSFPPLASFQPMCLACFSAAFATVVILSGIPD